MNSIVLILQQIPVSRALLGAFIVATIVLAIAQFITMAAQTMSAAMKHLLLITALGAFLAINFGATLLPHFELPILPAERVAIAPVKAALTEAWRVAYNAPPRETATAAPRATEPLPAPAAPRDYASLLLYIWATVAALLLSRVGFGILRVWWIVRGASPVGAAARELGNAAAHDLELSRDVRIVSSGHVHVPMIWGVFRPALLLPADAEQWEQDQLSAVLMHELGHLKRWDFLTLVISNLATSLFWFHPQVWFADLSARRECERACDDLVLNCGTKASEYAAHLLSIVRLMPAAERFGTVTLAMSHRSQLEGRLLSILHPSVNRSTFGGRAIGATAIATFVLVGSMAAIRLTASASPEREPQFQFAKQQYDENSAPSDAVLLVKNKGNEKHSDWNESTDHTGSQWYERAMELHHSDHFQEAIAAFKKAIALGFRKGASEYNIACGYSLLNDPDNALVWLQRSIADGFDDPSNFFEDSDLDPLRNDARFQALVAPYRADYESTAKRERTDRLEQAMTAYRNVDRNDGAALEDVGTTLLQLRQLDDGIAALERAAQLQRYSNGRALYNLACAYALRGDTDRALDKLEQAITNGFDQPDKVENDPDLRSIRGESRFRELQQMANDLSLQNHTANVNTFGKHDSNYSVERWAPAIEHYSAYVRSHPTSGRAWFNLAYAQHYSSRHAEAAEGFQRAVALDYRVPTSMYNVACAYAKMNQRDAAFGWLAKSRDAGFDLDNYVMNDEDLDSLRDDARFAPYREAAERNNGFDHKMKEKRMARRSA